MPTPRGHADLVKKHVHAEENSDQTWIILSRHKCLRFNAMSIFEPMMP